ncbi:MAG TPA: VOC family protein [Bacteroidia bacterium]|jgi:glyoxylase I family protein|nr:VOC family protein [Bacteroidia bacterium]HQK97693.1 VOC family protein [Bacteroidia bacterium]
MIKSVHHIAIICSDYHRSKIFYTEILGFQIIREVYRGDRDSYKLDLSCNGHYIIELFSFPDPAIRPSYPEAVGLRHLAFSVDDIVEYRLYLMSKDIACEEIRIDEFTEKQFFFFSDPDNLPLEIYQS